MDNFNILDALEEQDFKTYDTFEEYGNIGQKRYNGVFFEEFEKRLQGHKAVEVYKEMSLNDDIIGSILFAIEMLIKQATFYVEPASEKPIDKDAANFIEECLDDLHPGWEDTLTNILSFLTYGWSIHEICYKRRSGEKPDVCDSSKYSDNLIGWSKFAVRAQDTLDKWIYNDHDDLVAFCQYVDIDHSYRVIPIDKCLHFKNRSHNENPEGQSILRNAYRSYYFKTRIQEIEGIGIERDLVGLPMVKASPESDIFSQSIQNEQRRRYAIDLITNIRRNEQEGVLLPNGWEIELLSSGGQRQFDLGNVIERYDNTIASSVLADFVTLGHDGSGSYALSQSKTSIFYMAITSYLDNITSTINTQAIPKLINLNGDHFKGITDYPKLAHSDIGERDLTELSDYVVKLLNAGAIIPDDSLEEFLRKEGDLPMSPSVSDFDTFRSAPVEPETSQDDSNEESNS